MSTSCITIFQSIEEDGKTLREVARLWRKFDGAPTGHARQLQQIVGEDRFYNTAQLLARVLTGLEAYVSSPSYYKYYTLVSWEKSTVCPLYVYKLRINQAITQPTRDEKPAGEPYISIQKAVKPGSLRLGKVYFSGPLRELRVESSNG